MQFYKIEQSAKEVQNNEESEHLDDEKEEGNTDQPEEANKHEEKHDQQGMDDKGEELQQEEMSNENFSLLFGFKLVGDNIDKNVRPRYSRKAYSTRSMHCYHSYAVRDRVNIHGLSDAVPNLRDTPLLSIPVAEVLPSETDAQCMKHNFTILVSKLLVQHLKYFREKYSDSIENHIKHDFYEEMSKKSEIVCYE